MAALRFPFQGKSGDDRLRSVAWVLVSSIIWKQTGDIDASILTACISRPRSWGLAVCGSAILGRTPCAGESPADPERYSQTQIPVDELVPSE